MRWGRIHERERLVVDEPGNDVPVAPKAHGPGQRARISRFQGFGVYQSEYRRPDWWTTRCILWPGNEAITRVLIESADN